LQRLATARAVDRVRQRLRRRRREEPADLALAAGTNHAPAERVEAEELAAALRWGLAQLPARQAEAFCLHELGDWSCQDIADQLGISANAAGAILHRARQKLQELLRMKNRLSAVLDGERPRQGTER
jgi:RNA polymerase sigma-70 factor (ECF subfamily)